MKPRSGNWAITTQCINLSSLRLGNLGPNGRCSYIRNLCSALGHCNNLKDFRLDQSNIGRFDYLLDALSSCPKLQRVYLSIANNTDKLMEGTVMTFLKRTNKLLFFCACLRKTLFNSQLQSQVNNWFRKSSTAVDGEIEVRIPVG
uniref:F-box/LRR-repeat protein 18 LRR domain-containing protein n=1 Tax=Timema douglasi TaxID=61478 RepID=A0A7R8W0M0_TIMDO|nr:unnamed protein product [Timema douglasi]